MKKLILAASTALLFATTAQAAGNDDIKNFMKDVNYGAGIGIIDYGSFGTGAILYGVAEKEVKIKRLKGFTTAAQLRLGTSTAGSNNGFERKVDYVLSGMFKINKEFQRAVNGYAMLGISHASVTTSSPAVSIGGLAVPSYSSSTSDSSLTAGVGATYELNRDLKLAAEIARYSGFSANALSVNAFYNF